MKQNSEKEDFLVCLGTLGASLLGNLLIGKSTISAGEGAIAKSGERGAIRVGQDF